MIVFTPIRTRRLSVQLDEMTAESALYLCKLREDFNEAGTTQLLKRIVMEDPQPRIGQVTDVRYWTVQERALAVAHYLAHTNDGEPDFAIGNARYSDYILEGQDFCPESMPVGEVEGDNWSIRPLLGIHAEAIERMVAAGKLEAARHGWWVGAMAAQLFRDGEQPDQTGIAESQVEELIEERAKVFMGFPDSAFIKLLSLYLDAVAKQDHIFRLGFTDEGIVFMPVRKEAKEAGVPPARFQFDSALSDGAKAVFGNR